ncbi:MAG: LptA/OstA family protein [Asticcacaulis sp.]
MNARGNKDQAMKTYQVAAATVALGLALASGAAWGQASTQGVAISKQGGPVQVGSDNYRADQNVHTEYLDGRVEVQQADARLRADHIRLIHSGEGASGNGWGDVDRMEAEGNVYYVAEDRVMKGDNAVYTKADDTVVVTGGKVVLQQGQNVMTGTRIVAHPKAGTYNMDSSPESSNHGRVKMVLYPDQTTNGTAKPKAPASPAPGGKPAQ